MRELPPSIAGSRLPAIVATSALGGVLGGSIAAALDVGVTEMLKKILAVVSRQNTWVLIVMPLLGLALSVLVLYGFGLSRETQDLAPRTAKQQPRWDRAWRTAFHGDWRRSVWLRFLPPWALVQRWGLKRPQPISGSPRVRLLGIAG